MQDHRKIATAMELLHFEDHSPGMVFWHPNGWHVFRSIEQQMRQAYTTAGYQEVRTPQFLNRSLWERSGHWEKFADRMFVGGSWSGAAEDLPASSAYALKPMSCPAHIMLYQKGVHSYQSLPYRLFEFGLVHRNELAGAITGCMRLRQFTQDDAHVFCRSDQLGEEVQRYLSLVEQIYPLYGFSNIRIQLATRPRGSMGSPAQWKQAEAALAEACAAHGLPVVMNPGQGAFYGPKLEVTLQDSLGREWQCGTVQIDFNLPERFALTYRSQTGSFEQPLIVHQAVLGSLERWLGVVLENTEGHLPLWLAPVQTVIASISEKALEWAQHIQTTLQSRGFRAQLDLSPQSISHKIRSHSERKVPCVAIVGPQEVSRQTLNLRRLGSRKQQVLTLAEFLAELEKGRLIYDPSKFSHEPDSR